jgi:putative transposase
MFGPGETWKNGPFEKQGEHAQEPVQRAADGDVLREADTTPVVEVAKKHGISDQTIYLWRQRYGTLQADEVKRLRALEQENARLKKMVAERDLAIEVMKEIAAKKW